MMTTRPASLPALRGKTITLKQGATAPAITAECAQVDQACDGRTLLPSILDGLPNQGYVSVPATAKWMGISTATAWRWIKSGRLPAPEKLGPNTTRMNVGKLRRAVEALGAA